MLNPLTYSINFSNNYSCNDGDKKINGYQREDFDKLISFLHHSDGDSNPSKIKLLRSKVLSNFFLITIKDLVNQNKEALLTQDLSITELSQKPEKLKEVLPQLLQNKFKFLAETQEIALCLVKRKIYYLRGLRAMPSPIKPDSFQLADSVARCLLDVKLTLNDQVTLAGFSDSEIQIIKEHSAGTFLYHDLSTLASVLANQVKMPIIIGLATNQYISSLKCALNCEDFTDEYLRLYGSKAKAQSDFMLRLTWQNKPIIFLVPPQLMEYSKSITYSEMVIRKS